MWVCYACMTWHWTGYGNLFAKFVARVPFIDLLDPCMGMQIDAGRHGWSWFGCAASRCNALKPALPLIFEKSGDRIEWELRIVAFYFHSSSLVLIALLVARACCRATPLSPTRPDLNTLSFCRCLVILDMGVSLQVMTGPNWLELCAQFPECTIFGFAQAARMVDPGFKAGRAETRTGKRKGRVEN